MHPVEHFKTITEHRKLVREYCFRLGLYRQGLLHDLTKYSPVEFWRGARYYQGTRSPNNKEREETGVSLAWLHHKGRNKHHFEYWIDYTLDENGKVGKPFLLPQRNPRKYYMEMFDAYNCPDFTKTKVDFNMREVRQEVFSDKRIQVKIKP